MIISIIKTESFIVTAAHTTISLILTASDHITTNVSTGTDMCSYIYAYIHTHLGYQASLEPIFTYKHMRIKRMSKDMPTHLSTYLPRIFG